MRSSWITRWNQQRPLSAPPLGLALPGRSLTTQTRSTPAQGRLGTFRTWDTTPEALWTLPGRYLRMCLMSRSMQGRAAGPAVPPSPADTARTWCRPAISAGWPATSLADPSSLTPQRDNTGHRAASARFRQIARIRRVACWCERLVPHRYVRAGHPRWRREPESVGDVLQRVLPSLGVAPFHILEAIFSNWDEIVGGDAAAHCRPALDGNRLVIETADSVWGSEMTWRAQEILQRVQQRCGPGAPSRVAVSVAR